jgi:hypothetical protein
MGAMQIAPFSFKTIFPLYGREIDPELSLVFGYADQIWQTKNTRL